MRRARLSSIVLLVLITLSARAIPSASSASGVAAASLQPAQSVTLRAFSVSTYAP